MLVCLCSYFTSYRVDSVEDPFEFDWCTVSVWCGIMTGGATSLPAMPDGVLIAREST